jgi:hypothetical protein
MIEGLDEITQSTVIQPEKLAAIDTFIDRIENEFGFRVTTVVHKQNGDYEFLVNGGGTVLVASEKLESSTFENLASLLASKEFKHIKPGNFKYVDVRFDNKLFVNEQLIDESEATTTESVLEDATVGTSSPKLPE